MRTVLTMLALALAGTAGARDWSKCKPWVSAADKARGEPKAEYEAKVERGVYVFDVRKLDNAIVKFRVPLGGRETFAGKYMTYRLTTSGSGVTEGYGLLQGHYDRSDEGKEPKHYWKPSTFPILEEPSVWQKTRFFEKRFTDLDFTYEMRRPGVYRFHGFEFVEAPDPMSAWEPGRNYIENGGAERGFYATSAVGEQALRFGTRGGVIEEMRGQVVSGCFKPAIDETERHSGRRSFRLLRRKGEGGAFRFNPVPYVQGRECVLTFWVKASRKKWTTCSLLVQSGASYAFDFGMTTNWTKVTMPVPSFGKFEGGVKGWGDILSQKGCPYVVPGIEVPDDVTVWVDDAFYTVGRLEGDATAPAFASTAALVGNAWGVYRPGEPVEAEFRLENRSAAARDFTVTRRMLAWNNRAADDLTRRTRVTLNPGEAKRYRQTVCPPEAWRGPMNVVWEVEDADGRKETTALYFGVQEPCARPAKRLSVNVMFGSPEQTLRFLKEFGVGTTRLWGEGRGWHLDYGYAYSKLFHDNGIRNLFVLGQPEKRHDGKTLRSESVLPRDPTDWFAEQMRLVDAHRGEIDIYEFLNEFNIWGGRIRNPDPAVWADPTMETYLGLIAKFRPLLKKHDPAALLAGPCTCSTDLKFIGRFLEQGGGAYVDMITEHAYNGNPDCPDYARTLDAGWAMARKAGVGKWAQTEAGAVSPNHLVPGPIDRHSLSQAHIDVRNMVIAWAKGLDHYSHFQLTTGRGGTDWNLTYQGDGDNGFEDRPKPALYAFRACADRLGEAVCVKSVPLGAGCKCYVFDRGDRRVAVIWKWNGAPQRFRPARDLTARWCDFMGGCLSADDVILSIYPLYCETTLGADEFERRLLASTREGTSASGAIEGEDASDPNMQFLAP